MNPRGNAASLADARRRHSLDKRARVLTVLAGLEKQGQPLTFAAVARAAAVSTWLTYAPGVREHIEAAQLRQAHTTPPSTAPSPSSLRAELEAARQEIKVLRAERERLQAALRRQLGQQLDALHVPDSASRADELATKNQHLTQQLQQALAENTAAQARITALEEDLAAARTSLRRMIRNENLRA